MDRFLGGEGQIDQVFVEKEGPRLGPRYLTVDMDQARALIPMLNRLQPTRSHSGS